MPTYSLTDQQVLTLCGVGAYLVVFTLAISAAAIGGTLGRMAGEQRRRPPLSSRSYPPVLTPADEVQVAA
jgi:hypothetical protein